uniref:Uncharacterized protein n=1 Tax=Leersia perrieri TaxID=77586 RepID=A0A0D9XVT2_9ORYZ
MDLPLAPCSQRRRTADADADASLPSSHANSGRVGPGNLPLTVRMGLVEQSRNALFVPNRTTPSVSIYLRLDI